MVTIEENINDSRKNSEVNRILEKITLNKVITTREKSFLDNYDSILEQDLRDLSHLSKNVAFERLVRLLENKKIVICDLYDNYGKIEDQIMSMSNDYEKDECILNLKHGETAKLYDRFLYNINYDIKKDHYHLRIQDEYFEKIKINNED